MHALMHAGTFGLLDALMMYCGYPCNMSVYLLFVRSTSTGYIHNE